MNNYVIELQDVAFRTGDLTLLQNISFKLIKNTFTSIVGKSGSGKSTLLKIMCGIITPDTGDIYINSKEINSLNNIELIRLKKSIGFVFQDAALIANLSIKENLELPLTYHYRNIPPDLVEKKILQMLQKVNMENTLLTRPAALSLGEQKLISIARAMITEPDILFLDEPLSSIDVSIAKKMISLIGEYSDQPNTTLVAVTSSANLVTKLSDSIVVLDQNTIKFNKSWDQIIAMNRKNRPEIINDILDA